MKVTAEIITTGWDGKPAPVPDDVTRLEAERHLRLKQFGFMHQGKACWIGFENVRVEGEGK